ncbi:ferrochelatase [Achromatium sp. WMS1]|nr:ferrochelatase [Achromatium sp. WMS1]
MRYQNESQFRHDTPIKTGVLLVNLGTPNSPSVADVRRYLREFLSDPRVVEMPRFLWWLILHGIILPSRPKYSALAYQRIWGVDGSPLLVIAKRQAAALRDNLHQRGLEAVELALAMRYGMPSIKDGLKSLHQLGVQRILVLPMYPQYSATTTGSVFDAITTELRQWRWVPELRFIHQYHDAPAYINALVATIRHFWKKHGEPEQLLFSFHGIPKAYFLAGDPYYCHCQKTARLVVEQLNLLPKHWQVSFQSRVGPQEWLTPYTNKQLQDWGQSGIKKVHVVCPGFSADCLETLDEIAMENRDVFLHAGGKEYGYIPALNDDSKHITALANLIAQHLRGWLETSDDPTGRLTRARQMGAKT